MALKFIGERTVGTLNGMKSGFVKDDLYRVYDAGILVPGGVAVDHGDFVSWDGTKWVKEPGIKIATNELVGESMTNIAPDYTKTTYPANSYVMYGGVLYTNPNAIGTAEDWNPAHWTPANVNLMIDSSKKWTEKSVSYTLNASQTATLDVHDHEFVHVNLRRKSNGTVYLNMHLYGECYVYLDKGNFTVARTFVGASSSITTTDINIGEAKLSSGGTAVEFNKPSPSDSSISMKGILHYFGEETLIITPVP